jgi:uncharacterized protein (UPF0261 family)
MRYRFSRPRVAWLALALVAFSGCTSDLHDFSQPPESAATLAARRSRIFATADKRNALRAAIAALQELDFIVDRADLAGGTVSGVKADQYLMRVSVTVAPSGADRMLVRTVARYDVTPVLEAAPYEKFFAVLARILALEPLPAG